MEDTQFINRHHLQNEEDFQHTTGDGEHEHKSVLKKVKDKAKKIKNKITHKHENEHDLLTDEDDDQNDEEMELDPEIHGAPMYESSVISGTNLPRQIDTNLEKPAVDVGLGDDVIRDERIHRPSTKIGDQLGIHSTNIPQDQGVDEGLIHRPSTEFGIINPNVPADHHQGLYMGGGRDEIGTLHPYEKRDDQVIYKPQGQAKFEGIHAPSKNTNVTIGTAMALEEDPHSYNTQRSVPSNYESKVTDPTHDSGNNKEADVTPLVHRFDNLNVGNGNDESLSQPQSASEKRSSYTGSHDQFAPEPPMSFNDQFNQESSPKTFDSTKAESMPQDTVTGKVSSATSTIADKAAYAKNIVASKLGYGQETATTHDTPKKPVTEVASEYAHTVYDKVAGAGSAVMSKVSSGVSGTGSAPMESVKKPTLTESVAEKLAPVYGTVVGAGSAVISNVKGQEVASDKDKDKGGVSMKEYFVEKMRPGEEDKALSEAITDVFQKKKGGGGVAVGEEKQKPLPLGKVTESEEVARHLGSDNKEYKREGEDAFAAGKESSGQGMVERVKDAVGLWLGKSTGTETAQQSVGQAHVSGAGESTVTGGGEGKVQQKQSESSY